MNLHIARPWLALGIIFTEALVLEMYGMVNGAVLIFALLSSVIIYRLLSRSPY